MAAKARFFFFAFFSVLCVSCIPAGEALALSDWTKISDTSFSENLDSVTDMEEYQGKLYLTIDGATDSRGLWEYDGTTLSLTINSWLRTMHVLGDLYIGETSTVTGAAVYGYDGSSTTQINTYGFGNGTGLDETKVLSSLYGKLYAVTDYDGHEDRVYSYDGGTSWSVEQTDGFGDVTNTDLTDMIACDGKLYVSTINSNGAEIWGTDGSTWSQVNTNGFGDTNNAYIYALEVYGDELYAATSNASTGSEVWKYSGTGTTWTQVNIDGFGDPENQAIFDMTVYNNKLWAGVYNDNGAQVWSYYGGSWSKHDDYIGNENNENIMAMRGFDGKLYASTSISGEGPENAELWVSEEYSDLYVDVQSSETVGTDQLEVVFEVGNLGPDNANDVTVDITYPDGLALNSITGDGWTFEEGSIIATRDLLSTDESSLITALFDVSTGSEFTFNAMIRYGGNEFELSNNSSTEEVSMDELADTGTALFYVPMMVAVLLVVGSSLKLLRYRKMTD